jgi:D-alanine-D-alanine ligase
MPSPRVLVLYNEPVLPTDHSDAASEREVLETVQIVGTHLADAGFQVSRLGVGRDPQALLAGLREKKPAVVFNLFEGMGDNGNDEAYVPGLLEWLRIPFTGCPLQAICLGRNKPLVKILLQGSGLPTPEYFAVEKLPVPACSLKWPVIVKPGAQHASVGLDQNSVVLDQQHLQDRVKLLLEKYGPPVLVEEFILGREFNVAIIESPTLRVLPISEIRFVNKAPGFWPIVTYDAKWKPGSTEDEATPSYCPADLKPELADRLESLAIQAFRVLGCRDYARVDIRVRPSGKPFILEVNANPDFHPSAGLSSSLNAAGMTHAQFTVELVKAALARNSR